MEDGHTKSCMTNAVDAMQMYSVLLKVYRTDVGGGRIHSIT